MLVDLPIFYKKMNPARSLEVLFENTTKTYREIADSVHSKTLDTLYTDTFRPEHLHSGETTVMDLQTGNPIKAFVDYILIGGKNICTDHRREYRLKAFENNKTLGTKRFGVTDYKDGKPRALQFGFIESNDNDEVAGTQIRLLQATCEFATKLGIKEIPLRSMVPSVVFHTKMGFRPRTTFNVKLKTLDNFENMITELPEYQAKGVSRRNITPIISKREDTYYLDRNKSLYCSAMKEMLETIKETGKRHFSFPQEAHPVGIDMKLSDKELEDWNNRIKGFEILPERDVPSRKTFLEALAVFIRNCIS